MFKNKEHLEKPCHIFPLVRDKPLGAPASVKWVYCTWWSYIYKILQFYPLVIGVEDLSWEKALTRIGKIFCVNFKWFIWFYHRHLLQNWSSLVSFIAFSLYQSTESTDNNIWIRLQGILLNYKSNNCQMFHLYCSTSYCPKFNTRVQRWVITAQ